MQHSGLHSLHANNMSLTRTRNVILGLCQLDHGDMLVPNRNLGFEEGIVDTGGSGALVVLFPEARHWCVWGGGTKMQQHHINNAWATVV